MIILTNKTAIEAVNKIANPDEVYIIEGYACHFHKVNLNGEVVTADSFAGFFDLLKRKGIMPYMDYNHNGTIIGAWDSIEADSVGLKVRGHIYKSIKVVQDELKPLLENGELKWLSTMGYAGDIQGKDDGSYLVQDFLLTAISVVSMPADMDSYFEILNLERQTATEEAKTSPQSDDKNDDGATKQEKKNSVAEDKKKPSNAMLLIV